MKKIFLCSFAALALAACNDDKSNGVNSGMAPDTQPANIVLDLTVPDLMSANAVSRVAGDAVSYIGELRLLVFDKNNKLVYDKEWTNVAPLSFPVTFNAVSGDAYKFVVLANTDIAGSLTSPLVHNVNMPTNVYAYMKQLTNTAASNNGDTGVRYGLFTRTGNAENHIFYGSATQPITVGSTNTVPVTIKRLIAMVNLTVDIQNPTFQPTTATDAAFASSLYFDVSRMARAMDMIPAQASVNSASGFVDCVIRGGAFTYTSTGYQYKATAYVFGNGKNAFISFGVKTQKDVLAANNSVLLPSGSARLFWIDIIGDSYKMQPNKVYNIVATLPNGNMGGDPTDPGTVNPENPDSKNANLTVNITVQDWDAPVSFTGNLN